MEVSSLNETGKTEHMLSCLEEVSVSLPPSFPRPHSDCMSLSCSVHERVLLNIRSLLVTVEEASALNRRHVCRRLLLRPQDE